jgi:HK97 family phage major capsid protein
MTYVIADAIKSSVEEAVKGKSLAQVKSLRDTKSTELGQIFEKSDSGQKDENGQPIFDFAKGGYAPDEVKKRNDELLLIGEKLDALKSTDEAYKSYQSQVREQARVSNTFGGGADGAKDDRHSYERREGIKSLSEEFGANEAYKTWKENKQGCVIEIKDGVPALLDGIKTTMTTTAGYTPYTPADTRVVLSAQRRIMVTDLMPNVDVNSQFVAFVQETTFTNNAAAVAEGATKPESAFVYTRVTTQMGKVATTLPVTREQLMFVNAMEALLKNRLGFQVKLELEREVLLGSGSSPEMRGIQNTSGIQTQAQSTDDVFTAILKAIVKVNSTVGFADASGVVMNPNNWLTARTVKDTTGRFILGNPDEVGPSRIWGLPVVSTIAETAGTALVGDFQTYSELDRGMDLTVELGYINDDFTKNIVRMLAELFAVVLVYRPTAFCTVTGLA